MLEEEPEMDEALAEEELGLAEDEFPIRGLSGELTQAAYNRQYEDPVLEEEAVEGAVAGVGDENNPIAVRVKGSKEPMVIIMLCAKWKLPRMIITFQMKLRASPSTKISPEKIDIMIDLMNSLNQQFG